MSSSIAKPGVRPLRLIDQPYTLGIFILTGYGIIWLASHLVWYQITIEHELSQERRPTIAGVPVTVWTYSNNRGVWSRAWWCPFVRTCEALPPIGGIGVRLSDPAARATAAVFHSAVLRCADGAVIPLKLVADPGQPADQPVAFFENASDWIVDVSHDVPVIIGPAEVELDITVMTSGSAVREQVTVRLVPVVTRRSGFASLSA
jgi:hypothetical protein